MRRVRPERADACPDEARHTRCPAGYLQWHEWAEKKARTHNCTQCPTCGFWTIWKPKKTTAPGVTPAPS